MLAPVVARQFDIGAGAGNGDRRELSSTAAPRLALCHRGTEVELASGAARTLPGAGVISVFLSGERSCNDLPTLLAS